MTAAHQGQMSCICRLVRFCLSLFRPARQQLLEPRVESPRVIELWSSDSEEEPLDSDLETELGPPPIDPHVWVLPVARGSYFGREGLLPPTDGRRSGGTPFGTFRESKGGALLVSTGVWRTWPTVPSSICTEASSEESDLGDLTLGPKPQQLLLQRPATGTSRQLGERIFGWTFTHDLEARE